MAWTVKTAIFDIADSWGNSRTGLRSIDFYFAGEKIGLTSGFAAYVTSRLSTSYLPTNVFNTSLSKTGGASGTGWISSTTGGQPQRISCVFTAPLTFDEIRVNNYHNSGGSTEWGARSVKITFSGNAITSTAYGAAIANTLHTVNAGFRQHVAADIKDEQIINLRATILSALKNTARAYGPFNPHYIIAAPVAKTSSVKVIIPSVQLLARSNVRTVRLLGAGLRFHQPHTSIGRAVLARASTAIAYGEPVGFSFLNNGQRLPATYAHFVEAATGVSSLEIRMPGTGNEPEPTGAINVQSVAFSVNGDMNAADNIGTYDISEATFNDGQWKVFAYRTQVKRVPSTVPISQVLTLSDDGTQRRIRVPLTWGIGLGDTLTLPEGPPLTVGRCATSVNPTYRVVDITEAT